MRKKVQRIRVYSMLLWKRMWKSHKVFFLFALTPLFVFVAGKLQNREEAGVRVVICMEALSGEETEEKEAAEALKNRLETRDGILTFSFLSSEEGVKQEVAASRAECGYIIPADLMEKLQNKRYGKVIKGYTSPHTSMQKICEEALFAEIFALYEEMTFGEQAADLLCAEPEAGQHGQLAKRAEELFEMYRYNGSTFQFTYEDYNLEAAEKVSVGTDGKMLKGVLGVLIFVCGLCGTMDTLEDEERKRTFCLEGRGSFQMLTIYLPILFMSVVTLLCLAVCGTGQRIGEEVWKLLLYQFILLLYCLILKKLFGKEERLAAAAPVLILLTIVICPVFVDLSQFIPVFNLLEKAFPLSYYLHM